LNKLQEGELSKLEMAGRPALAVIIFLLCACSEMQQPPMTQDQANIYNNCMSTHWSSLADSALFGVAGYEYHQNQVLNCQQMALMHQGSASSDQPTAAAVSTPTKPSN
jgi:hypothetical protein